MGAQEFLDLVLPSQGIKVIALAVPKENGGVWFKYKSYPTAEAAARAAEVFDERGDTVYFAVNTFGDWYHDQQKDKRRIRTQENVVACRALFDDFDVDPDDKAKYDTRKEAFADVVRVAQALKLTPTITSSGGGYHVYFHLDEDIDAAEWEELSAMKRDVTTHLNTKADRAVDMRGLFRWALESQLVDADPTEGVKGPKRPKTAGFVAWTAEDVSKYYAKWPTGTKERVWVDVLLYTGLRRGDAVLIGRQHIRDGVATIKTEKTGTEVNIPILEPLRLTLDAGPTGDMHFIVGTSGKPLTKESFGNMFRAACNAAGVQKSAHGIRKIAATRAADAGATVAELEAMFGWSGGGMASLYTKTADRRRLALRGWGNKSGAE